MAKGPKGGKRPAAANARAAPIAKLATGEIEHKVPSPAGKEGKQGKDPAAVALGRKGGQARAARMSARKRKEIAQKAAKARWR